MKSVVVGPKKGWSKATQRAPTEKKSKKRKFVELSDTEFNDVEEDVPTITSSENKKSARKKTSQMLVMCQLIISLSIFLNMHRDGSMCSTEDSPWKGN
jgi:hypothetical protein